MPDLTWTQVFALLILAFFILALVALLVSNKNVETSIGFLKMKTTGRAKK